LEGERESGKGCRRNQGSNPFGKKSMEKQMQRQTLKQKETRIHIYREVM
jgi:hypothetical protein